MGYRSMRKRTPILATLLTVLVVAACEDDLTITDPNNPGIDELQENPTRQVVASAVVGMMIGGRDEFDDRNGYVSLLGILGRESYNFDGSDPRFITEMLEGDLNPSSPAFGGNLWEERYANIRLGTTILGALDKLDAAEMTDEEKDAVRGFVKTMQAHELLLVINTRDVNGAVIDFDNPPQELPAALETKSTVLAFIASLLDDAASDFQAAGGAFPFRLSSGYSGFDTPASFVPFNRALKARVSVYQQDWTAAEQALNASFIDDGAPLSLGVYHAFGTGSGDDANELLDPGSSPDILAHPSIVTDADTRANNEIDLRVQSKVRTVPGQTVRGITTDAAFSIYNSAAAPIPIIRNEELILLRAEINIGMNLISDAADDINFIRVNSGGLDPRTNLDATNILDELLKQRRYSLLFEGGHRWIDMRRYGLLGQLPLDQPSHQVNAAFPVPEAECLARGLQTCSAQGS